MFNERIDKITLALEPFKPKPDFGGSFGIITATGIMFKTTAADYKEDLVETLNHAEDLLEIIIAGICSYFGHSILFITLEICSYFWAVWGGAVIQDPIWRDFKPPVSKIWLAKPPHRPIIVAACGFQCQFCGSQKNQPIHKGYFPWITLLLDRKYLHEFITDDQQASHMLSLIIQGGSNLSHNISIWRSQYFFQFCRNGQQAPDQTLLSKTQHCQVCYWQIHAVGRSNIEIWRGKEALFGLKLVCRS